MVKSFTQGLVVLACLLSTVAAAPIVLPPGSHPDYSNVNPEYHILKREPWLLLPGMQPVQNANPDLRFLKREPIVVLPGSEPLMNNPNPKFHILRDAVEPVLPFPKREPIVVLPGSAPITNFDPEHPYHILRREPFILPAGDRPIEMGPDLPLHAFKRSLRPYEPFDLPSDLPLAAREPRCLVMYENPDGTVVVPPCGA